MVKNNKFIKRLSLALTVMVIVGCAFSAPASASIIDDIAHWWEDTFNTGDYTVTTNGDESASVKYDSYQSFISSMRTTIKDWFTNHRDSYRTIKLNIENWSDRMLDGVITLIVNNTAWTPDQRLELECYIMGWNSQLEDWRRYMDERDQLRMEQEMAAQEYAMEHGIEFNPETFVPDYSSLIPSELGVEEGQRLYDAYMERYLKHYQSTGDYGRENPAPF